MSIFSGLSGGLTGLCTAAIVSLAAANVAPVMLEHRAALQAVQAYPDSATANSMLSNSCASLGIMSCAMDFAWKSLSLPVDAPATAAYIRQSYRALPPAPVVATERRIALVFGNADYGLSGSLRNALNDANLIAATLRRQGFDVIVVADATQSIMRQSLREFRTRALNADWALVYFAGHAMETDTKYVLPRDAQRTLPATLAGVAMWELEDAVLPARKLGVVIVDGCRVPPHQNITVSNGMPPQTPRAGRHLLEAFSASQMQYAFDGERDHGPFAESLARWLSAKGIEIRDSFRRVHDDVDHATDGQQIPVLSDSTGADNFYVAGK